MTSQSRVDTIPGDDDPGSARTVPLVDSRPPDADSDIDDSFLVGIAAAPSVDPDVPTMLMHGTHVVGKYRIEARIGQGGMGTVYRATDTRLQRPVAIKIHHALGTRVERLRQEARMLARLSHPNVVTVLEVGTHDGMVFVAMEYVDGGNARAWLKKSPRSWQSIVALYREAGRGLAAAHALGIVHRDFKPDNVLVGSDGRPRVADFGLAGLALGVELEIDPTIESMHTEPEAFATEVGVMVGTPAYVAPEQISSSRVDARADQFGFCAALFEAIYGTLPFTGTNAREMLMRIASGELERPRERNRAPSWVLTVLERGMAVEPDDRFADMNALLVALGGPPRRRRFVPLLALGGALAIAGVALAQEDTPPEACAGEPPSLRWPGQQAEIAKRVLALHDDAASDAWTHLDARISDRVREWSSTHDAVCEAATTDRVADDLMRRDRELACLADAATGLDELLAEIAEPTAIALTRGAEVVEHLADPERCVGVPPSVIAPPPAAIAADVEALRTVVRTAATRLRLGRVYEARALAEVMVVRAQELGYAPLLADALSVRARARASLGMLDAGTEDGAASFEEARRVGYERGMADAADLLAHVAVDKVDLDEGLRWNTEARAHVRRLSDDSILLVTLITREAEIRAMRGEGDAARALVDSAAAFAKEAALGDEALALIDYTRAEIAYFRGEYGEAIARYEASREAWVRAFGGWHHRVAHTWNEIAVSYFEADNYVEARNAFVRALEIYDRIGDIAPQKRIGIALGLAACEDMLGDGEGALRRLEDAEHVFRSQTHQVPHIAETLYETRGVILIGLGRGEEALTALQAALGFAERDFGEAHVELRPLLANLALAAREAGDSELAEVYLQRALMIQSTLAHDDAEGAALFHAYGFLLLERGQLDAAAAQFERSGNIIEERIGIDSPDMGWVELGRGRIAIKRGNYQLARLSLERADALWSGDATPPEDRADMQRDLAVALWETGDRARALAVARAAAEVRPDDEVLRAWLAAHPGR